MTSEQWTARAEAYEEAADHLDMEWTNDADERKQGNILSAIFRREGVKCRDRADVARGKCE